MTNATSFLSPRAEYDYLQTPRAIRERCEAVFERAGSDALAHFRLDERRLPDVAERVLELTRRTYPDLSRIPYHGRYRHFDAGGVPRLAQFTDKIAGFARTEQLAARVELVITSVLLDAGAGNRWRYRGTDGTEYSRSEGLAVASYELYAGGGLGGSASAPLADAAGLTSLSADALASAFQVNPENPLTGLEGRATLLRRLGEVVAGAPEYFGSERPRLGNLGVHLEQSASAGSLRASVILDAVLRALGPIWQGRPQLDGKSLGDVWRHSSLGFVPFHKLSQWLTYSLFEPLEAAGLVIEAADELTGLAEYRNGGLFLDAEVLQLKDPAALQLRHAVGSDLVIEWRALTVALLDRTATAIRERLGVSPTELPLARILEGGTWRAGRAIALEKRADGGPPLLVDSDGTVF
ncbi:MAG TPA: URC4/urg3 family protein [Polyangiaceae bacterium]|nr:URC4/urg3 family protein [Polyangiaceae bacterium]